MEKSCFLAKIHHKLGFKGKPRIVFCDLVSLIFLMVLVVSWIFLAGKFETLGGFIKPEKKIETSRATHWTLRSPLRPPLRPSSPAGMPERFQFICMSDFMKPPKVSNFPAKNIHETTETIKKINETRSQKKKCVVSC